ncbi:MAG: hypothetical protein L3J93_02620 [Thermoplasmata archaeon]|nr:hypothetical protein [Thermoplasmata archaeon]
MERTAASQGAATDRSALSSEEVRWLHDKYERLAAEEGGLTATRTSYFAAIGTVLFTGLIVVIANLLNHAWLLAAVISFLAGLGILISVVWAILLGRTTDAQELWREAALRLERSTQFLSSSIPATIALRSGRNLAVDLTRPYEIHALRFSSAGAGTRTDRTDPSTLMKTLPFTFIAIWGGALIVVWTWLLLFS